MNERERAIGQRVKFLREKLRYSQREFGEVIGLTRIQLAAIEAGQTPLKYRTAETLLSSFGSNPVWLATGDGSIAGQFNLPSLAALKRRENEMFSEVFFSELWPLFENEKPDPEAEMDLRYQRGHLNANLTKLLFIDAPDGQVRELEKEFDNFRMGFLARYEPDNPKRRLQRVIWFKKMAESIKAKIESDLDLTEKPTSEITGDVNQWHALKARILEATKQPGEKSALAKFLGVDLTQLSRWLAKAKSAPEPRASYALKMLHWVLEREERRV